MQQSFQHIMTCTYKHQYFRDGLFNAIDISFSRSTTKLLRYLGIVIKPFPGGFHLLSSNPELLASEIQTSPFQFYLNCNDPHYLNHSELTDFSPIHDLLYFNNLDVPYNEGQAVFELHRGDFIQKEEMVRIADGMFKIPLFDEAKSYIFKDASNIKISNEHLRRSADQPEIVVINDMPQGLVRTLLNENEIYKIYHQPEAIWRKPLGIIEIFPSALHEQFKTYGKVNYSINFKNRETIWNYYFIDPKYLKFEDLKIINKEGENVFKPGRKTVLQNSSTALLFQSKGKIPLLEYSEDNFQLVEKFDKDLGYGEVIIKNLPVASPEQISLGNLNTDDSLESKTFYSNIYIY